CELGEYGTSDCKNCDDNNKCTKDDLNYETSECINEDIIPCKGNNVCEVGEYGTSDCPDCDDSNVCTKDSLDYNSLECSNEEFTPCCGNNKCERDTETHSTCSQDCKLDKCDSSQTESEKEICYNGKYLSYSVIQDDISICDEISNGAWLGKCYANFAWEKRDLDLCEDTPIIEYVAKGYYEMVNSKDVCYVQYLIEISNKMRATGEIVYIPYDICSNIQNSQMEESCESIKEPLDNINEILEDIDDILNN
ncbi:MAG: hypothetical protein KJ896_02775, partial [Nanoarchaeota archaeon]|nr:hypothetical protein [Nanoarchaeota archaeon]